MRLREGRESEVIRAGKQQVMEGPPFECIGSKFEWIRSNVGWIGSKWIGLAEALGLID